MPLPYNAPWEGLTLANKIERLHKDLRAFIDFHNEDAVRQNRARDLLEEALKRIETRVEKLEELSRQKKT